MSETFYKVCISKQPFLASQPCYTVLSYDHYIITILHPIIVFILALKMWRWPLSQHVHNPSPSFPATGLDKQALARVERPPLATARSCHNGIVCRLVETACLPESSSSIQGHTYSPHHHGDISSDVFLCGLFIYSFFVPPICECVCVCVLLYWWMPFLVWVVVDFEYWKAIFSSWRVSVNEWERMFSLWGVRTPEHMKVCARPLKRCCFILEYILVHPFSRALPKAFL